MSESVEKSKLHYYTKEPLIHSHIEDCVDNFSLNLKLQNVSAYYVVCDKCGDSVQSGWETMETWIETEFGNYCTKCWHLTSVLEVLEDNLGETTKYNV